jgi:hypothetical protein
VVRRVAARDAAHRPLGVLEVERMGGVVLHLMAQERMPALDDRLLAEASRPQQAAKADQRVVAPAGWYERQLAVRARVRDPAPVLAHELEQPLGRLRRILIAGPEGGSTR